MIEIPTTRGARFIRTSLIMEFYQELARELVAEWERLGGSATLEVVDLDDRGCIAEVDRARLAGAYETLHAFGAFIAATTYDAIGEFDRFLEYLPREDKAA